MMPSAEKLVDPWTARLLQRRVEVVGHELQHVCADGDGTQSLVERVPQLMRSVEAKYLCTPRHGERVGHLAEVLGKRLELSYQELHGLVLASILHDIGKAGVPEIVLFRPGKRTGAVRRSFQTHPVVGAKLLARVPRLAPLVPVVRYHHERWDGKGYPDGLSGEAIPLGARILAVADTFDALTAGRLYRLPMSGLSAIREITRHAGRQFDPEIASALAAAYRDGSLTADQSSCAYVSEREERHVVS